MRKVVGEELDKLIDKHSNLLEVEGWKFAQFTEALYNRMEKEDDN